jgi:hypothetical protein
METHARAAMVGAGISDTATTGVIELGSIEEGLGGVCACVGVCARVLGAPNTKTVIMRLARARRPKRAGKAAGNQKRVIDIHRLREGVKDDVKKLYQILSKGEQR